DEFLVVLVVAENYFVFVKDGRDAAAVLADERAKIALPNRFAFVVQRCEAVMLRFIPDDVNTLGVHCGGGSGVTVELMPWKRRERKVAPPEKSPVLRVEAEDIDASSLVPCA